MYNLRGGACAEFKEECKPQGVMEVFAVPSHLDPRDPKNWDGHLICKKNLVVDVGRQVIARIMAGEIPADPVTHFAIGTEGYNGTADPNFPPNDPLGTDTDLYTPVFTKAIETIEHPNIAANTYIGYITTTEQNGVLISEWALKTSTGVLFSRITTKPYPKSDFFSFVIRWTIQH